MTDLLSNVREDGDCLVWLGACANGHPAHSVNGRAALVRRTLWEATHGPIEPGRIIRCTCGTPKCVNPDHLEKTTHKKLAKQLGALGVMSGPVRSAKIAAVKRAGPQSKLTEADVLRIRSSDETGVALARELGVNPGTISSIRRGTHRRDFSSPWKGLTA